MAPFSFSRRGGRVLLSVALWLSFLGPLRAEATGSFLLETASGKVLKGPLAELRTDGAVRLDGPEGGNVPMRETLSLRRAGIPLPPMPRGEHLLFVNGDRLPCTVRKLTGQRLQVARGDQAFDVPLSVISALWKTAPEGPETEEASRLRRRLINERRTADALLLRNGDRIEGILSGLDEETITVESGTKALPVARSKVAIVALNTELASGRKPAGLTYRLVLRDGTRLSLTSISWAAGGPLTAVTPFRATVTIPEEDVVALSVLGGAAVYLSDLKPRRTEHRSYGSDAWPYAADASVDGRDLRLFGHGTFDKGLGTHSETRLVYDLGGAYRRFEALVGLGPEGRRGSARVRILVDGKACELPGEGTVSARTGPWPLQVDVAGGRELTLVVEFGDGGPVQDHVNWADARLIKK